MNPTFSFARRVAAGALLLNALLAVAAEAPAYPSTRKVEQIDTLHGVAIADPYRWLEDDIGWAWVSDYGSADDAVQFKALLAYSPLHNIGGGRNYPAILVTTGDHDDRVVPAHSFKYTAALQATDTGSAPKLVRIETDAGHGAGKPTAKLIEERADVLAFIAHALGLEVR